MRDKIACIPGHTGLMPGLSAGELQGGFLLCSSRLAPCALCQVLLKFGLQRCQLCRDIHCLRLRALLCLFQPAHL